jgi:hypothetical protein
MTSGRSVAGETIRQLLAGLTLCAKYRANGRKRPQLKPTARRCGNYGELTMTFFRNYEKAVTIRNRNAAADPDWQYVLHLASTRRMQRNVWVIEVRDQDGVLLGCL